MMDTAYNFRQIEQKWQHIWKQNNLYAAQTCSAKPKYYVLSMFPYPSGAGLHVGHPLGYIAGDIMARYKRMRGYEVLHPMGFDAFGLPAEQYAIETGQHPAKTTEQNMSRYKEQLHILGLSYDWDREICTSSLDYYRWTQWMFSLFFNSWYNKEMDRAEDISTLREKLKQGGTSSVYAVCDPETPDMSAQVWRQATSRQKETLLLHYRLAYLADTSVNWCPALGTVLSNDEVKEGYSERGGHPVELRKMKQWMLRITAYAERLLQDLDQLNWPSSLVEMQRKWIGKSVGAEISFEIVGREAQVRAFTTRPDTLYGVTFLCASPEATEITQYLPATLHSSLEQCKTKRDGRIHGFFSTLYAKHPLTGTQLPIWIANYVLDHYGTGVVMAVPAHDERDFTFAQTYDLPIQPVISSPDSKEKLPYTLKKGTLIHSSTLNGLSPHEASKRVIQILEKKRVGRSQVNFRLKDAIFARQRYWGEPLPIYFKEDLPQALTLDELPLELPQIKSFRPTETGDPPLARAEHWTYQKQYPYETSTMPGWAGSSWYFFRYMDPGQKKAFCSTEALNYWKDIDLYIGGAEHAVGHLLYARFWTKFLYDRELIPVNEFAKSLINQGMIYGKSYFVYRVKGENTYVSCDLRESYDTVALRVEHTIVQEEKWLDIQAFRKSHPTRAQAKFILEDEKYVCGTEREKMSKSKHNVVNPDQVIEKYGADTLRLYEMFLGPLMQNKPWDTSNIEGVHRFLKKYWRLFHTTGEYTLTEQTPTQDELHILHQTIHKVQTDIEQLSFNTAISALMIAVNQLQSLRCNKRAILEPLTLLLSPFAPHITEEIWQKSGHTESLTFTSFPRLETKYLERNTCTYAISINGKLRAQLRTSTSLSKEEVQQLACREERVSRWLEGKSCKRVIFVQNKILNIVTD